MEQYLIILEYRVDKDWFNDPSEVLKINLQELKIEKTISEFEIKQTEYTEKEFVSEIRVLSNLNKEDMFNHLKNHSTRIEKWNIK